MGDVDWGRELLRVKYEAEELATGDDQEAALRAGGAVFARMLVRTGAWTPEDDEWEMAVGIADGSIAGLEYGTPIRHYGPCYLHPITFLGKDGTRTPSGRCQVILGVIETPFVETIDIMPGRKRLPANPQAAGSLPLEANGLVDVARHLRGMVIRARTTVGYNREWQGTHPDHAAEREGNIESLEQSIATKEAGLRVLEAEFGDVLATLEANLSAAEQEREVGKIRRSLAMMDDLLDYVRALQSSPPNPAEESNA